MLWRDTNIYCDTGAWAEVDDDEEEEEEEEEDEKESVENSSCF